MARSSPSPPTPPRNRRGAALALLLTPLAGCTRSDVIATLRPAVGEDASTSADAGTDAGVDPVTGCPGPILLPGTSTCTAQLAASLFTRAVCVGLGGADMLGALEVDAFDSRLGPYDGASANLGGDVASNQQFVMWDDVRVTGDLYVVSPSGISFSASPNRLDVLGDLTSSNVLYDPDLLATVVVGGAAHVGGIVELDTFDVTGVFYRPDGESRTVTNPIYRSGEIDDPVDVAFPCALSPLTPFEPQPVTAAAATDNDNASIGLVADAYESVTAPTTITLPCGRFHLTQVDSFPTTLTIHVTGRAGLFVQGSFYAGELNVVLDPGATLDLFVGSYLAFSSTTTFGDVARPYATRVYNADWSAGFSLPTGVPIAALFYDPHGEVLLEDVDLRGAVYADTLQTRGTTSIHYDRAVEGLASECP